MIQGSPNPFLIQLPCARPDLGTGGKLGPAPTSPGSWKGLRGILGPSDYS